MNRKIRTVAILAVLCLTGAGCQKETVTETAGMQKNVEAVYHVAYTIDGVQYSTTLYGDQALQAFISSLLDLVHDGCIVAIQTDDAETALVRETVTYTTHNKEDALAWCVQKTKEGYKVEMSEDPDLGYVCIATK